jgi:catechol 2,3-dioxygenase-like lactoylglutathione lyase family enzyme
MAAPPSSRASPSAEVPFRPRAILETAVYADDLDAAERFYGEVLGLECFARAPGRHAFFRCGLGVFLVFNPAETEHPGGMVPPHGGRGAGHMAFAVREREMGAWRDHLARRGVAVEAEVAWPRGGRSLYVRDPAGNSIELATPAIWSIDERSALGTATEE